MVNTSLFSGLSGLRAHQSYIDVIGANLANVSTVGYRGSRVTFSDILSFTQRPGSGPTGNQGGQNPLQIGLGSTVASIDVDLDQGTFQDTGRSLDVALQGRGFFALTDGTQTFYSRAGTFDFDSSGTLVDVRSGLRVQSTTGGNITVPENDVLPAQATSSVEFTGALPATVDGPRQEILESGAAFLEGQPATRTTNAGPFNLSAIAQPLELLVSVDGGSQQRVTINPADPTGAVVLASEIEAAFQQAFGANSSELAVRVNGANEVVLETVGLGESATLKLDDAPGSVGILTALGLDSTLTTGSEQTATSATDLAQLTSRRIPYQDGDQISIRGTGPDGTPFSTTLQYSTAVPLAANAVRTIGDLVDRINALLPNQEATLALDEDQPNDPGTGLLTFTAADSGEATLSLSISDVGDTKNSYPSFGVSQEGTGPDTATASIDVIDSQGRTIPVQFTFTRQGVSGDDARTWSLTASVDDPNVSLDNDSIGQIVFGPDGEFLGAPNTPLIFNVDGIPQVVDVDLGTVGGYEGVTLLGDTATVAATDQDGFPPGSLLNVGFNQSGELIGFYSNGQTQTFDQLRVSVFPNEGGLLRAGDTLFVEGPNSDDAIDTFAGSAGAGVVRAGALENSNVDIAEEFVNLIQAQRGFQANSRVITTTDEILAELVNIVR